MNRVVIQSGYALPKAFAGPIKRKSKKMAAKRKKSSRSRRSHKPGAKMKMCAKSWKRSTKRGSYRGFMKSCLRGKRK